MSIRSDLIDIAMAPDLNHRRARNELAEAELRVTVLTQTVAETGSRLALAKAHVRHLRNEYILRYGEYL